MKPFDLEKAKAGHPLVTRGGKIVKHFYCSSDVTVNRPIIIWLDGTNPYSLLITGRQFADFTGNFDIFLADPPKVKKERYIAVCRNIHGEYVSCSAADKEKLYHQVEFVGVKICGEIIHHTWEEEAV